MCATMLTASCQRTCTRRCTPRLSNAATGCSCTSLASTGRGGGFRRSRRSSVRCNALYGAVCMVETNEKNRGRELGTETEDYQHVDCHHTHRNSRQILLPQYNGRHHHRSATHHSKAAVAFVSPACPSSSSDCRRGALVSAAMPASVMHGWKASTPLLERSSTCTCCRRAT